MRRVDRPDPLPDGMGLLHIGPPKTGTSALQGALHAARDELAGRGVDLVSSSANPLNMARFAAGWNGGELRDNVERRWAKVATAFRTSAARHPVLSSEGFSIAGPQQVDEIATALGRDVTVMISLRPLAAVLPSLWQQQTREGNRRGLDEWLTAFLGASRESGPLRIFEVGSLIEQWGRAFGADRIVVLCGPADRPTFQLDATADLLDVPGVLHLPTRRNASPPHAAVEMFRHVHLAHGQDPHPDRWIKVMREAGRDLGDQAVGVGGPVLLPRWAVDVANERDQDAREALEASGVLVVGDPAYLTVDPTGAPEVAEVPTEVDVETAGLFAAALARTAVADAERWQRRGSRDVEPDDGSPGPSIDEASAGDVVRELARRLRPGRRR